MATVTKDMNMGDILALAPEMGGILMEAGMHCVGCPAHAFESLEEASMVHGIDCDELVDQLNEHLAAR